jgi:Protein of unknown function (DUF2934)
MKRTDDERILGTARPEIPTEPSVSRELRAGVREIARTSPDAEESIRRRAYELYEQRGRIAGSEIEDWLQAEEEFRGRRAA